MTILNNNINFSLFCFIYNVIESHYILLMSIHFPTLFSLANRNDFKAEITALINKSKKYKVQVSTFIFKCRFLELIDENYGVSKARDVLYNPMKT